MDSGDRSATGRSAMVRSAGSHEVQPPVPIQIASLDRGGNGSDNGVVSRSPLRRPPLDLPPQILARLQRRDHVPSHVRQPCQVQAWYGGLIAEHRNRGRLMTGSTSIVDQADTTSSSLGALGGTCLW